MLKKHNKLIMLLVLVTFMFTMVGSAGAATFSDVTGNSVEAAAIYKLNGLGIIDGYPDGTFGSEKTITRAEFAKIACVTAGLKSVASGMGGTASPF
ncbi:MAG TPA: S-layer homology domain-containing protein, partial [Syntrophomonas sp.]|nr:S-layer homology domain-containing protein [Syntrophomonas sp.]